MVGKVPLGYSPVPALPAQLNADMILALAAKGMFSVEAANQYLTMTPAQKERLTSCFMMKMIQDKAIMKAKQEIAMKQQKLTKEKLRKNKFRMEKDKMKKSPHNQRYMKTLLKLKYHLHDSFECYDFLG